MTKVVITNVDADGKYEVIVYDDELEKTFQAKVDEFHVELYNGGTT